MREETRRGGCLCGAVRYEARGAMRPVVGCHCTQCRKQSGHYVAATAVHDDGLTITGGEAITWFNASGDARRGFCSVCGSHLFWKNDRRAETSIFAGSLESPTNLAISHHIFIADKGDYYEIGDGLPHYDGAGPEKDVETR